MFLDDEITVSKYSFCNMYCKPSIINIKDTEEEKTLTLCNKGEREVMTDDWCWIIAYLVVYLNQIKWANKYKQIKLIYVYNGKC